MQKMPIPRSTAPASLAPDLLRRFLRYVRLNTQSQPDAKTTPSTRGQWDLLRLLQGELRAMRARHIYLSRQGHLMATIPATANNPKIPTVAFLAHVDTSPDFSAAKVKPIVHRQWNGKPIRLPDDPTRMLDAQQVAELRDARGKDIVTAGGKTLLGADDKAGVAIIMALAGFLLRHPEIPHGPIRVGFLPDEEVGLLGASSLDLARFGADLGYTLDGQGLGEVVGESFSAESATVTIQGVAAHPGEAKKQRMVNAVHFAGKLLAALPREFICPETTDDHEGYLHPLKINGNAASTTISFLLRDFDDTGLADKRKRLTGLCRGLAATEPRVTIRCEFSPSYRNMAEVLRQDSRPVDLAREAMRQLGIEPQSPPIRGGTDGSCLSQRGLPTPNLSNGSHNPHGPLEWVAVQDMEMAGRVCLELVQLWAQKGAGYRGYAKRD